MGYPKPEPRAWCHFQGEWWWCHDLFPYQGQQYAMLMRETPIERVTFGQVEGSRLILPPPGLYQRVVQAFESRLTLQLMEQGESALPRVGEFEEDRRMIELFERESEL
jgi:hypothetical protein